MFSNITFVFTFLLKEGLYHMMFYDHIKIVAFDCIMYILDRSKTRIFWKTLEKLVSQRFLIDIRIIFQNCFTPRVIFHEQVTLYPLEVKRGLKSGGSGINLPFSIK